MVLLKILRDLATRDLGIHNVTPEVMAEYRQYWADLVAAGTYSTTYASHITKQWNAAVTFLFGPEVKPLRMREFPSRARRVEHLTPDDFAALLKACLQAPFSSNHDRLLFGTYLLTAWSTGARIGSLLHGHLHAKDIDFQEKTVRFCHMKNRREHTALLSDEATNALANWLKVLEKTALWVGPATIVFQHDDGGLVQAQWVNRWLKRLAHIGGVQKPVTTHVFRKSVATLMGLHNARQAREQLAVSAPVYETNYDMPTLADRLARRDLLPRIGKVPETPS